MLTYKNAQKCYLNTEMQLLAESIPNMQTLWRKLDTDVEWKCKVGAVADDDSSE